MRARTAGLLLTLSILGCTRDTTPATTTPEPTVARHSPVEYMEISDTSFCPSGYGPEQVFWDYGADPLGFVDNPDSWVRRNARGLDPDMSLKFAPVTGELEDIVLVVDSAGRALAYVDFGLGADGAFFPLEARVCRGAGIHGFDGKG